jgi:hypothetical protein
MKTSYLTPRCQRSGGGSVSTNTAEDPSIGLCVKVNYTFLGILPGFLDQS